MDPAHYKYHSFHNCKKINWTVGKLYRSKRYLHVFEENKLKEIADVVDKDEIVLFLGWLERKDDKAPMNVHGFEKDGKYGLFLLGNTNKNVRFYGPMCTINFEEIDTANE